MFSARSLFSMLELCLTFLFSFVIWSVRSVVSVDRIRFVRGHLERREDVLSPGSASSPPAGVEDSQAVRQFVGEYLRVDGVFLLRMIAHNTSGVAVADITLALWNAWYERRSTSKDLEAGSMLTARRRPPAVE